MEQEAELRWQAPNDLQIVMLGRRQRTAIPNAQVAATFTKPWFVPRALGDSIRFISDDFPDRAAVHPLAGTAGEYYDYEITDSLELALPGRTVRAIGVRVTPRRADAALIAGTIWLDAETAETVRMTFGFVGRLWANPAGTTRRDTARADAKNRSAMQVLRVTADLEYGLFEQRYWLPFRQTLTLTARVPWIGDMVIPINFITTFRDVTVNGGVPIVFTGNRLDSARRYTGSASLNVGGAGVADTARRGEQAEYDAGQWHGGRYEIVVPPRRELDAYQGWRDSLALELSEGDAERLEATAAELTRTYARLSRQLTGARRIGLGVDRVADILRFNRGEGLSLGFGTVVRLAPFVSGAARARYAFGDGRVQGLVGLRRDGVRTRSEIAAFAEMRDADPLAPGLTVSNALTSLLLSHDEGSYVYAEGAEFRHLRPVRRAADLTISLRAARESGPRATTRSGLFSDFQPNTPVLAGDFATATISLTGGRGDATWLAGVEATAGDATHGRVWVGATQRREIGAGLDISASGWLGHGVGDALPQRRFRLGGARTLRGFDAGSFQGASAWSASLDLGLARRVISPVLFVDAGSATNGSTPFTGQTAASAGLGISAFRGALRLHWATPIDRGTDWRFDLILGSRR